MTASYLPKEGVILARVNYPLKPEKIKSWLDAGRFTVTLWNVIAGGQEYALIVNGDHRFTAAIQSGKRPHYVSTAPEFRAAFYKRSDAEKLAIVRTWGGGSPEWINVETGERIDALSAPMGGAS